MHRCSALEGWDSDEGVDVLKGFALGSFSTSAMCENADFELSSVQSDCAVLQSVNWQDAADAAGLVPL